MKLQICRASGLPIKYEEIEQYNEDYRALYDKIKTHVLGTGELMTQQEAMRMQKLLSRLGPKVLKRYELLATVDVKGTKQSWLELVAQHGPIALAKNSDTNDLAIVIMDASFGG